MSNPFLVSLASLPRQEGASMPWHEDVPAPPGLGVDMLSVVEGSPLHLQLTFASVSEGVWVSGTVNAQLEGQCSRCLADLHEERTEEIGELVYYPERHEALVADGDEEVAEAPVVVDEAIDIEPIVRDAIVLALPFTPLCRPDCPGLCPECGERWDDLPADHAHEAPYDARFDALAALEEELRGAPGTEGSGE